MGKLAIGSLTLAMLLSISFFGYALVTGTLIPYPDPTPEQAAHERYHGGISDVLFQAAALAWLVAIIFSVVWIGRRVLASRRAKV